jgi:hypothetical protein
MLRSQEPAAWEGARGGFMKTTRILLVLALAAVAVGCQTTDPTAVLPGIPQTLANDTFTGAIPVGGSTVHSFTIGQGGGPIGVMVTAVGPSSSTLLVISVGRVSTGACDGSIGSQPLGTGQSATTAAEPPGDYCVSVADGSNTGAIVTYALTVTHP